MIIEVNWDYGSDFGRDLLQDIQTVALRTAPFKIETVGYQIYWAGTVLRIDIKQSEFQG